MAMEIVPSTPITPAATANRPAVELTRHDFPKGFVFGAGSASYQFEGAVRDGGKGISVWDNFVQKFPDKISDGTNGNVAVNFYSLYKEDVQLMKKIGLNAYRFSISWSRVLPCGKISGGVNKEGVKFYNELIDELLANGIEPYVTLFHWDLPQALEDEYGGFLSQRIVADYRDYVQLCFWEFGDRVKNWATFNEPWSYAVQGYVTGSFPPGRGVSSDKPSTKFLPRHRGRHHRRPCEGFNGNAGVEPYIAGHNMLLAHAAAVDLYRRNFQVTDDRKIGIVLNTQWNEPLDEYSDADKEASLRAMDFNLGWFLQPVTTGDYPTRMKNTAQNRLPQFTDDQKRLLAGSIDYLGLNYYTGGYATPSTEQLTGDPSYLTDIGVTNSTERDGEPIGPQGSSSWLSSYPKGIRKVLNYIRDTYNPPYIVITENGIDEANNPKLTINQACLDPLRTDYHRDHLYYLKQAIDKDSINVKGYFVWSFLDNFEWADGFSNRFGMIFVDYKDALLNRYPKGSAIWYMRFLNQEVSKPSAKRYLDNDDDSKSAKKLKN